MHGSHCLIGKSKHLFVCVIYCFFGIVCRDTYSKLVLRYFLKLYTLFFLKNRMLLTLFLWDSEINVLNSKYLNNEVTNMPFQNWAFVSHLQYMVSSPCFRFKNLLSISKYFWYLSHKEIFFWNGMKISQVI